MRKRQLVVIAGFALLVTTALVLSPSLTTRYAAGYSKRAFASLKTGMTYGAVTNILGLPLNFTVISEPDKTGSYVPPHTKQLERISAYIAQQPHAQILLYFSEKRIDLIYESVEVFIAHDQLTEARRYWVWDD